MSILDYVFYIKSSSAQNKLQHKYNRSLKVKPGKCELLKRKVSFLGHVVSADGPTKVAEMASTQITS